MVTLHEGKHYIINNDHIATAEEAAKLSAEEGKKQTLTYQVLEKHNHSDNMEHLEIKFDSMGVYDNTYVGILQTAYASGLKEFPMPCVFTNCHNCLCAVGGTINTDVHKYAESACKKSGGIFVPPHEAVIHQYMREIRRHVHRIRFPYPLRYPGFRIHRRGRPGACKGHAWQIL